MLLAWEMNGEPIPPIHGGPLRVIVPGHVAVRNVKWVTERTCLRFRYFIAEKLVVAIAREEAEGPWQRGIAYKGFGPSVKSVEGIDVERIPSLQEQPVQSAITIPQVTLYLY